MKVELKTTHDTKEVGVSKTENAYRRGDDEEFDLRENMVERCKYADKYQGIHPPKCNGGNPCGVCKQKWKTKNE